MAAKKQETQSGLELNDILLVFFKHKWKILACTIAGLVGALIVFLYNPTLYESQAKLLVKYVLERSGIDEVERTTNAGGGRSGDSSVIGSELEILTSWDLALETAEKIDIHRVLAGTGEAPTTVAAAAKIVSGMTVEAVKGTNVISVSYRHRDPEVAKTVLDHLIRRYKEKHIGLHRSGDAYDFVTQQRDSAKRELTRADTTLRDEKKKAEIVSLPEGIATITTGLAAAQLELYNAEMQRAEQSARLEALEATLGARGGSDNKPQSERTMERPKIARSEAQDYQALVARLASLRQAETDLLSRFLPSTSIVKANQQQIASVEGQIQEMEARYPDLMATAAVAGASQGGSMDIVSERARLAAAEAKVKTLRERLQEIRARAEEFVEIEPRIAELLRVKEVNETNYKLLAERLEKSRVDETLDPERIPNIGFVQKPSPAVAAAAERNKTMLKIAGGGLGVGIALAFLFELIFNRTVKRPLELETRLGVPLLQAIPFIPRPGVPSSRQQLKNGAIGMLAGRLKNGSEPPVKGDAASCPWSADHFVRPFAEAVRDRLVLYFELSQLTRKPKLVAVTSLSEGAGVSTLAGGLAAALSETGEGKVLLVDMNVERTEVQPFFHGEPSCSLIDALQPAREMAATADNLYLATVADSSAGPMQLVPKRFYDLLPHLKASDFDYIIFDMPPVRESSATLAIAGFMDKVLFVVEAEADGVDALKRSVHELTSARANLSGIFNKGHSYAPRWMKAEF